MSGYNYGDQGGCRTCASRTDYSDLENTTHYDCDQHCSCRNTTERSDKDKMYYNYFVLGKPMNLQPWNSQTGTQTQTQSQGNWKAK